MPLENVTWYGHDAFKIVGGGAVVYVDPWQLPAGVEPANLVLVSHDHFDHCAPDEITRICSPQTTVLAAGAALSKLGGVTADVRGVGPGERIEIGGIVVETVPAYNLDKFREAGKPFHPKEAGYVGFLITIEGKRFYHTGDSDFIPEMKTLGSVDVAFVPVSGTYVMTAEEAAASLVAIHPGLAIPMHYGSIVGTEEDAKRFAALATTPVEILPKAA
jgi:L-ascorbate metabolism protein UlaG (beta-lactamase superfamily)